jgi:hypothetical protein
MGRYRIAASEWTDGDDEYDSNSLEGGSSIVTHHRPQFSLENDRRHAFPSSPRQHLNSIENDSYYVYKSSADGSVTFVRPSEFDTWIDSSAHQRRNRGTWRWYIGSTLMAVVAYLCYYTNHLPPAPPPSAVFFLSRNGTQIPPTWSEFVHGHTWQWLDSTLALCVQTPYAILRYWTMNVVVDMQMSYQRWMLLAQRHEFTWATMSSTVSHQPISCQWHIPLPQDDQGAWITTSREGNDSIVGQKIAVEWLANSIYSWEQKKRTGATLEVDPLVVLATGYEHTGKRTLAYRVMTSTWRKGRGCHADPKEQILHLKGRDWVLQDYERDEQSSTQRTCRRRYHQLISVIESHIHRRQSRTSDDTMMILITNIEEMDPCILAQFLKYLLRSDVHLNPISRRLEDENPDEIPVSDAASKLHELCRNSIIYLTSNTLGLSALARCLRQGNRDYNPLGLAADLRDAVQRELPDPSLVPVLSSILPFLPFTPESLAQLFRHRLQDYWTTHIQLATPIQLVLTDAAVAALLNDNVVEYVEVGRPSETLKLVVDGAQAIPDHPFLNHWYTQLHQVVELLPPEPQPTATLVLDFDPSTVLPGMMMDRGVWQLCDGGNESKRHGFENCIVLRRARM